MNEEIKKKLVALEAEVDAVLFRYMYEDEEKQGMGAGTALKVGAGLGALGAGAYLGDRAIMKKYGWPNRNLPSKIRQSMGPGIERGGAYSRAANDAMDAAKGYGQAAMNQAKPGMQAGMKAWQRSGAQGAGMFSRLRRVLGGATRALTGGRFGFSEIESRLNRLIEMSGK